MAWRVKLFGWPSKKQLAFESDCMSSRCAPVNVNIKKKNFRKFIIRSGRVQFKNGLPSCVTWTKFKHRKLIQIKSLSIWSLNTVIVLFVNYGIKCWPDTADKGPVALRLQALHRLHGRVSPPPSFWDERPPDCTGHQGLHSHGWVCRSATQQPGRLLHRRRTIAIMRPPSTPCRTVAAGIFYLETTAAAPLARRNRAQECAFGGYPLSPQEMCSVLSRSRKLAVGEDMLCWFREAILCEPYEAVLWVMWCYSSFSSSAGPSLGECWQ